MKRSTLILILCVLTLALLNAACTSSGIDLARLHYQESACEWVAIEQEPSQKGYYAELCRMGKETRRRISQ